MPSPRHGDGGFKRQVVIRVSPDDWPLLQQAAASHGSYQAALLAGLRSLTSPAAGKDKPSTGEAGPAARKTPTKRTHAAARKAAVPDTPRSAPPAAAEPINLDEEIRAREAAKLLGLTTGTVAGYIRNGRIPGRYDDPPTWLGWVTTRRAVEAYRSRTRGNG